MRTVKLSLRATLCCGGVLAVLGASCEPPAPTPKIGFRAVTFPADFAFGTATAGWQNEGDEGAHGPVKSNWSSWMAKGKAIGDQTNPRGNGFFTNYVDDIGRAKALGLDTFRLSLDWSRVEPEPGVFDEDELAHFDDVLTAVRAANMKPVLTLYHWTVPVWVQNTDAAAGPVVDLIATNDHAVVDAWEEFVRAVIPRVKDKVDTYTVLNEPLSMVVVGYINATFPPGVFFDIPKATSFGINLAYMQARAFDVIKQLDDVDADGDGVESFVGLTMTANEIYPEDPANEQEQLSAESLNYVYNDWFIQALTTGQLDVDLNGEVDPDANTVPAEGLVPELAGRIEFIGVQYYGPVLTKELALLNDTAPLYGLPLTDVAEYTDPQAKLHPHNGMGREISASGFQDTLRRYAQWDLPLIVTENGTTTNRRPVYDDTVGGPLPAPEIDDAQAAMFVVTHLWEVGRAIHRGVDIRGYYHWTLADNYEWVQGTLQRFGAYRVDFNDVTLPRTLTPMGEALRDVVSARGIDAAIWKLWVDAKFPTDATDVGVGTTTSEPVVGALD